MHGGSLVARPSETTENRIRARNYGLTRIKLPGPMEFDAGGIYSNTKCQDLHPKTDRREKNEQEYVLTR